jgi:hypothetical protein
LEGFYATKTDCNAQSTLEVSLTLKSIVVTDEKWRDDDFNPSSDYQSEFASAILPMDQTINIFWGIGAIKTFAEMTDEERSSIKVIVEALENSETEILSLE